MEKLLQIISEILEEEPHFLGGLQKFEPNYWNFQEALTQWGDALGRDLTEIMSVIQPCIRQSILISLIPSKALSGDVDQSLDLSIREHLNCLGLELSDAEISVLTNICINIRKLQGLSSDDARRHTLSLAELKGMPRKYASILKKQNNRCLWCGVSFDNEYVEMTLEHIVPKHIGDDVPSGANWGLSCNSCNNGKGDSLSWSASPWAHDFFNRNDFLVDGEITLKHRWTVLRRTNHCTKCLKKPQETEIWVFRRIKTGLPVPSNCSSICLYCSSNEGVEILKPIFIGEESRRWPIVNQN